MRPLLVLGALTLGFALAIVSLPWLAWALGCAMLGDDAASDRAADASPIARYLEWSHRHYAS